MDIVQSLDPALYMADETAGGIVRPGLIVTDTFSGDPQSRDYADNNRRVYDVMLEEFPPQQSTVDLRAAQFDAFLENAKLALTPFRINVPVARRYAGMCYPRADGSEVWFDLPGVFLEGHGILVMVSDVYSPEADWSHEGPANIVPNHFASLEEAVTPTTRGYTAFGSCSLKWRTGETGWGIGCILVDVTGSAGNVGFIAGEDSSYGEIAVDPNTDYTAAFAFRGAGTFRAKTQYYQSDRTTPTGTLTTGTGDTGSTSAWNMTTVNSTSPANAAFVRITCERVTTSSDKWLGDCVGLVPQGYPRWHWPPCAPDVIKFGSAPADKAWVRMGGNATAFRPRVRVVGEQIRYILTEEGTEEVNAFRVMEVFR